MTNEKREKVISAIEACIGIAVSGFRCSICPYVDRCNAVVQRDMLNDALALLKAQEPVEPIQDMVGDALFWVCGKCGHDITSSDWYCANCGREVKWE